MGRPGHRLAVPPVAVVQVPGAPAALVVGATHPKAGGTRAHRDPTKGRAFGGCEAGTVLSCQAGAHAGVVRERDNVEDIEDPCRCRGIGLVVLRGGADINTICHEDEDDKEEGPERSRHGNAQLPGPDSRRWKFFAPLC